MVTRYLIRRDRTADLWMIWDRQTRGAAEADGRQLVRLTLAQAEMALVRLTGEVRKSKEPLSYMSWQVTYGAGTTIPCAHEVDAKLLARELVKRGHRVSARTVEGVLPSRSIEPWQIYAWLTE